MTTTRTLRALVLALPLCACHPTLAAPNTVTAVDVENDAFWATWLGEQSTAVASFGPTFETPEGLFRQWSLVIHLPGTPEPLSCLQGLAPLETNAPIHADGDHFEVSLQPLGSALWGDVRSDQDLKFEVEGLY